MLWAIWLEGSSFLIWFLTIFRNLHVDSAKGWRNFWGIFLHFGRWPWVLDRSISFWLVTVGLVPLYFRRLFVCHGFSSFRTVDGFSSFRIVDNQNWVIRWLILCIVCLCCYYVDRDRKLVFYCVNFNTLSIFVVQSCVFRVMSCPNVFDWNVMFSLTVVIIS